MNYRFEPNLCCITLLTLAVAIHSCGNNQIEKQLIQTHSENADSVRINLRSGPIDTAYYKRLLMGTLNVKDDSSFVMLPSEFTTKPIYLNSEAAKNLVRMIEAAKLDNVELTVLSGYRSYSDQKAIWTRKWNERNITDGTAKCKDIMLYSAMPKTSRHHWGTDVDLNSLDNSYFTSNKGKEVDSWLFENAGKFGFQCVYTDKSITKRMGYELEKWHWSYMPIATKYLQLYNQLIGYQDISGFPGSESARDCKAIEEYVNGITSHL